MTRLTDPLTGGYTASSQLDEPVQPASSAQRAAVTRLIRTNAKDEADARLLLAICGLGTADLTTKGARLVCGHLTTEGYRNAASHKGTKCRACERESRR